MRTDRSVLARSFRIVLAALVAALVAGGGFGCTGTHGRGVWSPGPNDVDARTAGSRKRRREARAPESKTRFRIRELVVEALAHNRTVAQARVNALVSGTFEREARAALIPTVGARGTYTRVDEPPSVNAPELGTSFTTGPKRRWDFGLTADFPIFGFGRHFHAYKAAAWARRSSEADRAASEADVATAVTAAGFDLLEGYRAIDAAAANEKALQRQVRDSDALLSAGRVTKAALLDAQVAHDSAIRDRERLEAAVPILRMRLNVLLGRPADAAIEVADEPIRRAPVWKTKALVNAALAKRPELHAARLAVSASERSQRAARARELPELRGQLGWDATDSRFANPKERVTLLLSVDIPIFTAGARPARLRRAEHESDLARIRLRELEAQMYTEVADALRRVQQNYKDIAVAKRSIERSEESQRIQSEKFSQGRATSREVLDATATLRAARFAHIRALYDYNVALYELHRARGGDPRGHPFAAVDRAVLARAGTAMHSNSRNGTVMSGTPQESGEEINR